MICLNCNSEIADNARFCPNCGFRFDAIRQVEPIRIDIAQPIEQPPTAFQAPPVQPAVIVRERKSGATGAIVALTVLVTLLVIGALSLLAYYLLTRQAEPRREIAAANVNPANSNTTAASPQPTTYEDLKNKLAPPDKRAGLIDESFAVEPGARRAVEFNISQTKGARVVGGFRVSKGKGIDFLIARGDVDGESSPEDLKPLLEQTNTRNKIVNQRLKPGDYLLIFANDSDAPATVAAEFFIVED